MAGGNQDHLVGPILCFTLRDQSYISKVPDPQKVFKRTEWISVLAEPNPIRFGKSSKMNSSLGHHLIALATLATLATPGHT